MADVKNPDEPTLPIKRPIDSLSAEPKKPKLHEKDTPPPQNDAVLPNPDEGKPQQQQQQEEVVKDEEEEQKQQQEEEVINKEVIDRKGKGILIEEDEENEDGVDDDDSDSDSDSDSGIGDGLSGDESDFADDPLAEVDLDNILPSRTRRKTIHPGVYLANDLPPEDSDDSDDPDA